MPSEQKFRIKARTTEGVTLTYSDVASYEIRDGMCHFIDSKTGEQLAYPSVDVNIRGEKKQ